MTRLSDHRVSLARRLTSSVFVGLCGLAVVLALIPLAFILF